MCHSQLERIWRLCFEGHCWSAAQKIESSKMGGALIQSSRGAVLAAIAKVALSHRSSYDFTIAEYNWTFPNYIASEW